MKPEYQSITQKRQRELEEEWFARLRAVNRALVDAETVRDYAKVLNDTCAWNNISYCLRRYLYESFTGRGREEEPMAYSVSLQGRTYSFSPVIAAEVLSAEEQRQYADLCYRLTVENRCFAAAKDGTVNPKKGAISKQSYLDYLGGKKSMTRPVLFTLSMALKFGTAVLEDFMNALGMGPVYQFRDVTECIYYFCHNNTAFQSMAAVRMLRQEFESRRKHIQSLSEEPPQMTRKIRRALDQINQEEYPDEEARKEALLDYLLENSSSFTGYSQSAAALFRKEYGAPELLNFDYTILRERDLCLELGGFDQVRTYIDARGRQYTAPMTPGVVGAELYGVFIEGIDLDERDVEKLQTQKGTPHSGAGSSRESNGFLDPRIKENLLNGERLRDLLNGTEAVTKKDLLLLRFYKLVRVVDFSSLSEREHLDLLNEFHTSTDRTLLSVGLTQIYAANPFDNLILTALSSRDPQSFFPMIFQTARVLEEKE